MVAPVMMRPPFASLVGFRSRIFTSFFFPVAILSFFRSLGCGLVDVSRTEEQLTATRDVSFRNQVIEPDQFSTRPLLNLRLASGRIFFRGTHSCFSLTPFMPKRSGSVRKSLPRENSVSVFPRGRAFLCQRPFGHPRKRLLCLAALSRDLLASPQPRPDHF